MSTYTSDLELATAAFRNLFAACAAFLAGEHAEHFHLTAEELTRSQARVAKLAANAGNECLIDLAEYASFLAERRLGTLAGAAQEAAQTARGIFARFYASGIPARRRFELVRHEAAAAARAALEERADG